MIQAPSILLCHWRATSYNNIIIGNKIAGASQGKNSEKKKFIMRNNRRVLLIDVIKEYL
jgi:hypothetical protein